MHRHGIYTEKQTASRSNPVVAQVGIPFFIGAAPVQCAPSPAPAGDVVLLRSWEEAVEKLGFVDYGAAAGKWAYSLCEAMHSHFRLYECQPAVFCNLLDPGAMSAAVPEADVAVEDNRAALPAEAIDSDALTVKAAGGAGAAFVKGEDYDTYYHGGSLIIELLETGGLYNASALSVAYRAVTPGAVTAEKVAIGLQNIEKCLTSVGLVPDIVCAPGYSQDPAVAAVMATKTTINGLFRAKALVDISTSEARTYSEAFALKEAGSVMDRHQVACWPMLKEKGRIYHMGTHLAGLMARVDDRNGGCPYESPSNKPFICDAIVLGTGEEVKLTHGEANILEAQGVVTALNFINGITCWGNYTACYPASEDEEDYFISVSRMFDWVANTVTLSLWERLDQPLNTRLRDSIVDTVNIWLNGLVGAGYMFGGFVETREIDNPPESLKKGVINAIIHIAPPPPFKEGNFILRYDASFIAAAFS